MSTLLIVLLVLLILPLWISYLMRMLAWVNLLAADGYVNRFLTYTHILSQPRDWLGGRPSTVILALVYGYIPYLILPLFAALGMVDTGLRPKPALAVWDSVFALRRP